PLTLSAPPSVCLSPSDNPLFFSLCLFLSLSVCLSLIPFFFHSFFFSPSLSLSFFHSLFLYLSFFYSLVLTLSSPSGWHELLIASVSHRSISVKDRILLATRLHA